MASSLREMPYIRILADNLAFRNDWPLDRAFRHLDAVPYERLVYYWETWHLSEVLDSMY